MADASGIVVGTQEGVVRVTWSEDSGLGHLAAVLRGVDDASEARVLLISGRWDCAPADLAWAPNDDPIAALAALRLPTVAWIDGACHEEGLELALAADIRIASPEASFRMAHAAQGRMPSHGGTQRLARLAGRGRALQMLLTGEPLSADEASRAGLAQTVGGVDEAFAIAAAIAKAAPIAAQYVKEAVRASADLALRDGLRLEADLSFLLHSTADRTEGLRSFIEKRPFPPRFEGR